MALNAGNGTVGEAAGSSGQPWLFGLSLLLHFVHAK